MFTSESVDEVTPEEFDILTEVWEASVRATHDFVSESDIQVFRPIVRNQALPAVVLRCVRGRNRLPVGFIGVAHETVEMLYIDPEYRGQGAGRALLEYAVRYLNATQLDVNEQNPQALGFYLSMGFTVIGRSEVDGMGKPYPLLHMKLSHVATTEPSPA
jgi:putative acetyltransferase